MTTISGPPRVSIILPFFEAQAFLAEAIDSVSAQTFPDWELLLVDDGSPDASREIAERHATSDRARVFVLQHDARRNRGLPATRNLGLRHARGSLIALLDADDVWRPDKLAQQVELLAAHDGAAMVYGKSTYWNPDATSRVQASNVPPIAPAGLYEPPSLLALNYPLGPYGSPCPSDLLFRRDAALQVGGFAEDFAAWEDIVFLSRMFVRHRVCVADECWDWYRVHPQSMSARARRSGEDTQARRDYFRWLEGYLLQEGVRDTGIWKCLRGRQWELRHPRAARGVHTLRAAARKLRSALGT